MRIRTVLAVSAVLAAAAVAPARRPLGSTLVSAQPAVPAQRALIRLEPLTAGGPPTSSVSGTVGRSPSGVGESIAMFLTLAPAGDCFSIGGGALPMGIDVVSQIGPGVQRWWTVHATFLEADVDRVTAAVQWKQEERAPDGVRLVRGDSRTLTFHPDQPLIIDAMRSDEIGAACHRGVLSVALRGQTLPPEGFEREWVRYDVWLEHRGVNGVVRRHLRDERRHGSKVAFDFAPMRQPAVRRGCEAELQVNGAVQALARADGELDLVAHYGRIVGLAPRGEPISLGAGFGEGGTRLTVRDGEAVRFILPGESGLASLPGRGACAPQGGRIDVQQLLEGQETSLTVRVTRLGAAG